MKPRKIDKTQKKNWIDGDTFLMKIKNVSEEYKDYEGKYFAFINKSNYPEGLPRSTKVFYVKYIDSDKKPESVEGIKKYPSIRMFIKTPYEAKGINQKLEFDKYQYTYIYYCEIQIKNSDIKENFEYIGNLPDIKNEYEFPVNKLYIGQGLCLFKNCQNDLLFWYESYNLKKLSCYTKEGNEKHLYQMKEMCQFTEAALKFVKENSELMKEIFKDEKRTNNSLTYVGSDPEKMKQNRRKN